MKSISPSQEAVEKDAVAGEKAKGPRKYVLFIGVAAFWIIFALISGFGLGLGLKDHNSPGNPSVSATSTNVTNSTSTDVPLWRRDPQDYNLDMGWDLNAAPTTRLFNFTLTEIEAAPDGKESLLNSCRHCTHGV